MMRRQAPTEPPKPQANSPPLPSCRSGFVISASSGLCEHLAGNDAIRLDPSCHRCAGRSRMPSSFQSSLANQANTTDSTAEKSPDFSSMPALAQSAARETSPSSDSGLPKAAMPERSPARMLIDHRQGQGAFVLLHILQLRTEPGPAAGSGCHTCAACRACDRRRAMRRHSIRLNLLTLARAASRRNSSNWRTKVIGLVREHLGHRALVQRAQGVTVGVDCRRGTAWFDRPW